MSKTSYKTNIKMLKCKIAQKPLPRVYENKLWQKLQAITIISSYYLNWFTKKVTKYPL